MGFAFVFALFGCTGPGGTELGGTTPDAALDAALEAPADAAPDAAGDGAPGAAPPPAPRPWLTFPAHPFRTWLDDGAWRFAATLPDGRFLVAGGLDLALATADGIVTRRALGAEISDLALDSAGETAVAAAGDLVVIHPADLSVRHTIALPQAAHAVALSADGRTALAATDAALHVVDLGAASVRSSSGLPACPGEPFPSARIDRLAFAHDGGFAFAARAMGLAVLDLRDPSEAICAGFLSIPGGLQDVTPFADGTMVFASRWLGVSIIDVSDPSAPTEVGTWDQRTPGFVHAATLSADERQAWLATDGAAILLDLSDPTAPRPRSTLQVPGALFEVALEGEDALLAGSAGLLLLDVHTPPDPAADLALPPDAWVRPTDVQLSPDGHRAYIAGEELLVADLRDRRVVASLATGPTHNLALSADGRTLAAAGSAGLLRVDVTDAPRLTHTFDAASAEPMDVVLSARGPLAFIATEGGGGLDIVDLDTSRRLSHIYIRHTQSLVVSADEGTAYVADPYENGFLIIDIRDPQTATVQGRLPRVVDELALSPDGTLVAATGDPGLLLIDVGDPEAPAVAGELHLTTGRGDVAFSADGHTVYVADGDGGLRVVDVRDPANPRVAATFNPVGDPTDLAITADGRTAVLLAEARPQVRIVDLPPPPRLEPDGPARAGVRRYRLRWQAGPAEIAWHVTGGHIAFDAVDHAAGTARVEWTLPEGPAELAIAVGNHHGYQVARVFR